MRVGVWVAVLREGVLVLVVRAGVLVVVVREGVVEVEVREGVVVVVRLGVVEGLLRGVEAGVVEGLLPELRVVLVWWVELLAEGLVAVVVLPICWVLAGAVTSGRSTPGVQVCLGMGAGVFGLRM